MKVKAILANKHSPDRETFGRLLEPAAAWPESRAIGDWQSRGGGVANGEEEFDGLEVDSREWLCRWSGGPRDEEEEQQTAVISSDS
jgi:hypothetical protein